MSLFRKSLPALMREAQSVIQTSPRQLTAAQADAREMTLEQFVMAAWGIVEPGTPLLWNWHLSAICQHLEALLLGTLGKNNLVISVPPGSGKSRLVSVMAPAWYWIRNPGWKAIFASGNPRVSTRDSLITRNLIGSHWYKKTFGISWKLADDQDQKTLFGISPHGGFRMATTPGSGTTGDRAHALFIDDPLDSGDANSKAAREAVNVTWYAQSFANRLNDLRVGTRCIIAQRLHHEDLIGHVLATEPNLWEHLMIPMQFEPARRFTTLLGWTDPRVAENELMFAERFPIEIVAQERQRLGNSAFAGQLQQRPVAAEGELFKRGCLQMLTPDALPRCSQIVISLDTAFSEKQTADYSVAIVMGQHERGVVILDIVRGRYAYPQLKAISIELAAKWRPSAVIVENKASGQSLVQSLRQETSLPVRAIEVDRDKVSRAHSCTATWESGRVFAPIGATWLEDFEWELYSFPKAPHDDQTDAFVQALRYLTASTSGWIGFIGQEMAAEGKYWNSKLERFVKSDSGVSV